MRVVLVALLAIGVLNALPLEQASGLEASGTESSGTESSGVEIVSEGSGLVEDGSGVLAVEDVEVEEAWFRSRRDVQPSIIKSRRDAEDKKNDAAGVVIDYVNVKDSKKQLLKDEAEPNAALRQSQDGQNATTEAVEEGSGSETNTTEAPKCPVLGECQDDKDCNGGRCIGAALNTCNCNACLNYWPCSTDADCGGFNKACNNATKLCDCFGAYVLNGFKDTLEALGKFCNVQKCGRASAADDCKGLPCNSGRCFC